VINGRADGCRFAWLQNLPSVHHHPPKLPQESVDIRCPPFSPSAINSNRNSLPPPLASSSVKDHINISVAGETLS